MTGGNPRPRQTLPKSKRLRKRSDFLRIQASGARVQAKLFVALLAHRVEDGPCRLGIVASRKVGGAVERNRAKRLVREVFRRQAHLLPHRLDMVLVVRPNIAGLSRRDVEADLIRAIPVICRRATELSQRPPDS